MADVLPQAVPGGLDAPTKGKIKNWVLKLRDLLEKDFATQLRRYGIEPSSVSKEPPAYLSDDEKKRRKVILATIRKEKANEGDLAKAVEAYIREAAYTYINRLVGLKCMETRGILFVGDEATEVITTRAEYGGRSRLLWALRSEESSYRQGAGTEERLWRDGLLRAFEAVTKDIRVLFDPKHEYSQLLPTHGVLMEAVGLINGLDAECGRTPGTGSVFASPDFLGWVYQFFNAEERVEIRRVTGGTPRTSHELAVINQFYTPDWIVKFLVDNTLGRVWLQTHPDTCLYHGEPGEKFTGDANMDYLVPQTGEDERVAPKPVGEMKLLDPACGTMHFGQYAFRLFYAMYLEEQENAGQPGWPAQPSVADPADIPATILANNLYGIDIDARAIQIAALSLLLTAKEEAHHHGLDPRQVAVRRMNLVIADAVNLGAEERDRFLHRLDPWEFGGIEPMQRAVDALWKSLDHVAELGSLVQPGDEVERALSTQVTRRTKLAAPIQPRLGDGAEWGIHQPELASEQHATAREYLLDRLQEFAATNGDTDVNQRLFAQETEKGLRLLDALRRQYDVVVMNPPFGKVGDRAEAALDSKMPLWSGNVLCSFILVAGRLCEGGFWGSVVDQSTWIRNTYESYRRNVLLEREGVCLLADAGWSLLDGANVQAGVQVGGGRRGSVGVTWVGCAGGPVILEQAIMSGKGILSRSTASLRVMPNAALACDVPDCLMRQFVHPPLDPTLVDVRVGLSPMYAERFYRYRWETSKPGQSDPQRWVPIANGGAYSPHYRSFDQVVDFGDGGRALLGYVSPGGYPSSYRSPDKQMRGGLTFSKRGHLLNVQPLPVGYIFTAEGEGIFPRDKADCWWIQSLLNAQVVRGLINAYCGQHKHSGYVALIPVPPVGEEAKVALAACAQQACTLMIAWDAFNETGPGFRTPWLLEALSRCGEGPMLADLLHYCHQWEAEGGNRCSRIQQVVDSVVFGLYSISSDESDSIECYLGTRPPETVWPQMAGRTSAQKRLEHVHRLLSYAAKTLVERGNDGIVPLVPCGDEQPLIQRARGLLDEWFGAERGHAIESEISNELGARKTMESWFSKDYFKYHVSLYKKRPIFWHITTADGSFGVIVHYHRFNRDRLDRLRSHYLFNHIQRLQSAIGVARADTSPGGRDYLLALEQNLEAARALDEKLRQIAEGDGYRIQVPWKTDAEQPKGWDPDLDDGVKVNIGPFQQAGVLAVRKVV